MNLKKCKGYVVDDKYIISKKCLGSFIAQTTTDMCVSCLKERNKLLKDKAIKKVINTSKLTPKKLRDINIIYSWFTRYLERKLGTIDRAVLSLHIDITKDRIKIMEETYEQSILNCSYKSGE